MEKKMYAPCQCCSALGQVGDKCEFCGNTIIGNSQVGSVNFAPPRVAISAEVFADKVSKYKAVGKFNKSNVAVVEIGELKGVINKNGDLIVPLEYEEILINGDYINVYDGNTWEAISLSSGKFLSSNKGHLQSDTPFEMGTKNQVIRTVSGETEIYDLVKKVKIFGGKKLVFTPLGDGYAIGQWFAPVKASRRNVYHPLSSEYDREESNIATEEVIALLSGEKGLTYIDGIRRRIEDRYFGFITNSGEPIFLDYARYFFDVKKKGTNYLIYWYPYMSGSYRDEKEAIVYEFDGNKESVPQIKGILERIERVIEEYQKLQEKEYKKDETKKIVFYITLIIVILLIVWYICDYENGWAFFTVILGVPIGGISIYQMWMNGWHEGRKVPAEQKSDGLTWKNWMTWVAFGGGMVLFRLLFGD